MDDVYLITILTLVLQTLRASFCMYEIRTSDMYDAAYRFRKKIKDPRAIVSFPSFRPDCDPALCTRVV